MRRLLCALAFVFSAALQVLGQNTATITGNISDPTSAAVTSRTVLNVELKNTGGQQCRVGGVTLVSPYLQSFTPQQLSSGFSLLKNSAITCGTSTGNTQWAFTIVRDGSPQPTCYLQISANTNLNSASCLNAVATPVTVQPTDALYARLDGSNAGFTGNITFAQPSNGADTITATRATDTTPTGNFVNFKTLAGASVFKVDVSGNVTAASGDFANSGTFTTQEQDYLLSSVNSCNPQTEIQAGQGNTFWNVSAITGCVQFPVGGTNTQVTGIAGLAVGPGTWPSTAHGALVGVYGQARCTADNCGSWGGNLISEDDGLRTAGQQGHGLEIDVGQQSPSTAYGSLAGVVSSLGGNGTGLVSNSFAFEAGVQSTPHNLQWNWSFFAQAGASANGVFLGPTASSGTVTSQNITFQGLTAGVGKNVVIGASSGGSFSVNPATTGSYLFLNGNMEYNGVSTLTPTGGGAVLASDSTAGNVLKLSNNGDTFSPVSRTIASGTAAMTTAAIASGACGTTVTVAAAGVATTDVVNFSFNAAVGANPGVLIPHSWPTSGNVNFNYCNPTAGSVTPSAATLNWQVVR